jgi:hypothetical protein
MLISCEHNEPLCAEDDGPLLEFPSDSIKLNIHTDLLDGQDLCYRYCDAKSNVCMESKRLLTESREEQDVMKQGRNR